MGCMHWRIQGGAAGARPPTGSISFIFPYVLAEKCTRQRLVPPPMGNPGSATGMVTVTTAVGDQPIYWDCTPIKTLSTEKRTISLSGDNPFFQTFPQ